MLHASAISTQPSPSSSKNPLSPLVDPENCTSNTHQPDQIAKPQRFCLEDLLQERQIYHCHLSRQTARNGIIKHFVPEQANLASQHALSLAPARQCIEHIEKDEASERHGGVARVDGVVDGHFADVDDDGAEHDDGGGGEDALDESPG